GPEVQEPAGEQPPPLAVRDRGRYQRPLLEERRPVVAGDAARGGDGQGEDRDVQPDERRGDERASPGFGARDRHPAARPAPTLADAVDALVTDGCLAQALRTGGPP